MAFNKIIISRTDSIGDVILTLPLAGILKKMYPSCQIIFLGKSYTKDAVLSSKNIDIFVDWEDIQRLNFNAQIAAFKELDADTFFHIFPVKEIARLAYLAKIPLRIGTTGRIYHYLYCNKLIPLTRRRASLHEAQLNLKLLKPLGVKSTYSFEEIQTFYGLEIKTPLNETTESLIDKQKFNLILHPKSKGSAREWGLKNYSKLIAILPEDKFKIFITGTREEGIMAKNELIDHFPNIIDLTGKLSLKELISFIKLCDGLLAASTGPLHIAAALGKHALGLYPPIKPMHPGRWAPIGKNAEYLVLNKNCSKCRNNNHCECLESIAAETVYNKLLTWINGKDYPQNK
jgi:ADP-heptose:LPS heptosyltransferase